MSDTTTRAFTFTALFVLGAVFVLHALHLAVTFDDAYISFRYARNLADGYGFVWNIDEPPVEGFTNLLWVLISAALFRIDADVVFWTRVIGIVSALGTMLLTYRLARRHMGASPMVACLPVLLLAFSGPLATWAASGMETTTFGFFFLLGVYGFIANVRTPNHPWAVISGMSFFLATLLRPEGLIGFTILTGLTLVVFRGRARGSSAVWGMSYLIPLILYIIWRLNTFEDPLPNTFYQKTGGGLWQYVRGASYVIFFAMFFIVPVIAIPALLLWERGIPGGWKWLHPGSVIRWIGQNEAIGVCGILFVVYYAYVGYVGGDYMPMYRFMVPALPFLYLLLVPATGSLLKSIGEASHKRNLLVIVVIVGVLGTVIHSTPFEKSFFRRPTWQMGNHRGVMDERWVVNRFSNIGQFFAEQARAPGESLATRTIGAIGFVGEQLSIHDLHGLTDRRIAHAKGESDPSGWAGHEKWDLDYSFGREPTFIMIDALLLDEDISRTWAETTLADAIERNFRPQRIRRLIDWIRDNADLVHEKYEVKSVWMEDEITGETGYFAYLELRR